MSGVKIVTACPYEPVTVDDMQAHSRIDTDADYTYLAMLIASAREYIETITWRQLMPATLEQTLDDWPAGNEIALQKPPLISVDSVKYTPYAGGEVTFSAANYFVDTAAETGRLRLKNTASWPTAELVPMSGIRIRYLAGYGPAALTLASTLEAITTARNAVPLALRHAIRLLAAHWYENREQVIAGDFVNVAINLPMAFDMLVQNHRVNRW